jgi:hypothetical protein
MEACRGGHIATAPRGLGIWVYVEGMAGDRTSQELYLNPREDLMIDTTTAALGYIILF